MEVEMLHISTSACRHGERTKRVSPNKRVKLPSEPSALGKCGGWHTGIYPSDSIKIGENELLSAKTSITQVEMKGEKEGCLVHTGLSLLS